MSLPRKCLSRGLPERVPGAARLVLGRHVDRVQLGLTIPVFVISMLLILVFAVWLGWLPASGWGKPERWILPIIAYAAIPLATYARYTRSAMLDTLNRPFVTALRAKGLSERRIIFQHVLRNSAIPMVAVFLVALPTAFLLHAGQTVKTMPSFMYALMSFLGVVFTLIGSYIGERIQMGPPPKSSD